MTTNQWLLECLAEECAEVAQRVSKANRFGIMEVQPGQFLDNTERLMDEIWDLVGVATYLQDKNILPGPPIVDGVWNKWIVAKHEKVEKYLAYAKDIGIVRDPNHLEHGSWARKTVVHPDVGWKAELMGRYEEAPCDGIGPYHGDRCSDGRIQSPNAQFTRACLKCEGTGLKKGGEAP